MVSSTLLEPADNPYRSSVTWDTPASRSGYTDDDVIELRAFVGAKADHFLRKWLPRLEDPQQGDVRFSWIAFFFPVLWLGFRKMYLLALIVGVVPAVLSIAQQLLFVNALGLQSAPLGANVILNLLACVVCGLYGNAWYLNHAEAAIAQAHKEGFVGEHLLLTLAHRGGTSVVGLIGMWVLNIVVGMVTGVALVVMQMSA